MDCYNYYRYPNTSYLAHHGIKGQKWGIRRYQNEDGSLTAEGKKRYDYKEAKKEYKELTKKKTLRKEVGSGIGMKSLKKYGDYRKKIEKSELNVLDKKAALAKERKGEKGEFKAYRKAMQKSGIPNSMLDDQSRGRSSRIYDHLVQTKGEEYANRVTKSVQNHAIGQLATGTAIMLGSSIVSGYIQAKNAQYWMP